MSDLTCDVFCRVIDNYGDAGIAWRLVKSLAAENGWRMRLIIDDAAVLSAIVPAVDGAAREQSVDDVDIVAWTESTVLAPADVVVELFSCRLPDDYEAAIDAARSGSPCRNIVVLAVDYLTAEAYAEGSNGLQSPHPRYGYPKTFLFPGFSRKTCGFLREKNLAEQIERYNSAEHRRRLFQRLGADPAAPFTLFYFTYPETPVAQFARSLARDPRSVQIIAAPGKATDMLVQALHEAGEPAHIRVVRAPMVAQNEFDGLLAACDACLVRGEDSTMRAQLMGRPLIWTLYPQSEDTHLVKLAAFEKLYAAHLTPEAAGVWRDLVRWLNGGASEPGAWSAWRDAFEAMKSGAVRWQDRLLAEPSQTERITQVVEKQLK